MGRKVCLKKIENITRRQVTFSKRRSSIMKMSEEISICCDAEVVFIAFSPSGRITRFSCPKRIEELIDRYVSLPAHVRYNSEMENVQDKVEKLRYLDRIEGDKCKLQYLDRQIENLELQVQKKKLQLQIMEANIRAYEPLPGEELNLYQLIWNERNLKHSLEKVIARMDHLSVYCPLSRVPNNIQIPLKGVTPLLNNFSWSCLNTHGANASVGKLPVKIGPQIVPHSAEVRERLQQNILDQEKRKSVGNHGTTEFTNCCRGGNQSSLPPTVHEPRFVPPMEGFHLQRGISHEQDSSNKNAIRSVTRCDPKIPSWNVLGNDNFAQTTHDIHPPDLERHVTLSDKNLLTTILMPPDENLFATFAFNNGQIAIKETQAPNDQILPPPDHLNIGIYKRNNSNINSCNVENGLKITDYVPAVELNPPPARFSEDFSLKDLFQDNTPWTSHAGESGFLDHDWKSFPLDGFNCFID